MLDTKCVFHPHEIRHLSLLKTTEAVPDYKTPHANARVGGGLAVPSTVPQQRLLESPSPLCLKMEESAKLKLTLETKQDLPKEREQHRWRERLDARHYHIVFILKER